ncbi:MAG: hypothetical protein HWD58_21590 [Bacteroidota bacterium]|nr:MAG: hypothetical protein HWD58_21590 [Bacteroidota bacterium]
MTLLLPAFAIGLITLNSNSGGVGSPDLTNSPQEAMPIVPNAIPVQLVQAP